VLWWGGEEGGEGEDVEECGWEEVLVRRQAGRGGDERGSTARCTFSIRRAWMW
jgi:hypothetical protein